MSNSTHLALPFIDAAQAQKHVTHNDALNVLDIAVHLSVIARNVVSPPASPAIGARYLVGAGATGAFLGNDRSVAAFQDGAWRFLAPLKGWRAWIEAESILAIYDGANWFDFGTVLRVLQNLNLLGIGTAADATNPLAAKLNATLFTARTVAESGTGDLRFKLNKETAGNTASQLYQTGYSGRAETGLLGNDHFHIKVSPDGTVWRDVIDIDPATGIISFLSGTAGLTQPPPPFQWNGAQLRFQNPDGSWGAYVNLQGVAGVAGAQGGAGPAGANGAAGPPGLAGAAWNQWKGVWSAAANYVVNDAVSSNGSSYVAVAANLNSAPPSANWNIMAQQGALAGSVAFATLALSGLILAQVTLDGYLVAAMPGTASPPSVTALGATDQLNVVANGQVSLIQVQNLPFAAFPALTVKLPPGLGNAFVTADGYLWGVPQGAAFLAQAPAETALAALAVKTRSGSQIVSDAGLRLNYLSATYRPAYDGALWLAQASGGAAPSAYVSWDRRGNPDQNLSIGTGGIALTPAAVAGAMGIDISYGESLSVGGNGTVAAGVVDTIAKTAVDPGNALMPAFADATVFPLVLSRQFSGAGVDLVEAATYNSSGGTHLPGLAKVSGNLQAARGAKLPTLYVIAGVSGSRIFQLSQQGTTPYFANLARTIRNMIAIAVAAGRQPVPKPVKWLQGANDSGSGQGLKAADYVAWLKRLLEDINMVWRQLGGWHPAAPDIPMLMIQPDREGVAQRSGVGGNPGGARVYKLGADGPRIGIWNAALNDPRLMLAGSHYQFPMSTAAGDNGSHLAAESYWRAGEMMAIAEDALMFGPRWRPLMPIGVTLVSSTIIDVQTNSFGDFGQALSIDTVRVADMADAGKGFAVWNNASGTAYAVASVAVSGTNSDTIRLTLGSAIAALDQPWIDYALWRDDTFTGNAGPGSPGGTRGNIRLANGWTSTVDAPLGRVAGTTVDYHWMVGARVPAPTTSGQIWPVDRRIA